MLSSMKKNVTKSKDDFGIPYYALYSILFLMIGGICFFCLFSQNKSLVSNGDALNQHFSALGYYGKYLRGILRTFFETGNLSIPLWDSKLGFGADVITTLNYYVIGDPLTLLSALVPASKTEYLYGFLIILRLYLSGLGFLLYCRVMKKDRLSSICGAFVYTFSAYALYASTTHPFFANSMIYLPFLLIGIEKIFQNKTPYLFIIMVFISALSNFYFFYVLSILIFIYAVVRFFDYYKERRGHHFLLCLGRFSGYYFSGVLLSGILLLPGILAALSTRRFNMDNAVPLFYQYSYYKKLLFGIFTGQGAGNWTFIGCSIITFPALVILLMQRKKYRNLKVCFLILTGFLLIPYIGHIFNVFSYSINRWSYAYCFMMAFILVCMIPEFLHITKKKFILLTCITVCYLILCNTIGRNTGDSFLKFGTLLVLTVLALPLISFLYKNQSIRPRLREPITYLSILILITAGIACYGFDQFYSEHPDESRFHNRDAAYSVIVNEPLSTLNQLNDPDFFRYELMGQASNISRTNSALLNGLNGMDFYYSIADENVSKFLFEVSGSFRSTNCYRGLDNRIILDSLANVKYQVTDNTTKENPFYGYALLQTPQAGTSACQIYQNQNMLPFGYTYDSYLPRADYESLSPTQKQAAMLQAAVLDSDTGNLKKAEVQYTDLKVPYKIKSSKNVTYENGSFYVKKPSASVTFVFNGIPDSENYLIFQNLQYKGETQSKSKSTETSAEITAAANDITKSLTVLTPEYRWYEGRNNYLLNFAYSSSPLKEITITFQRKGSYTFDDIIVNCQPMDHYISQINLLKQDYLKNTVFSPNRIKGSINLDSSRLLCMTIPYSKGWSAYVNGNKTELYRVNTIYSGILLDAGEHKVELKYFTPGLGAGIFCSLLGIISFIVIIRYRKFQNRRS
ncbi:YfhO family protein [Robinsoniella peoriensis]|uniref:YfhO family protein n=1 Tax=Robinsoniella peoriensis TaxID=180332 RepID=UPI0009F28351|nr:YfhO family protein [Robinsoniella peoriensis]